MFLATVITVYKSGIHLEEWEQGVHLHICIFVVTALLGRLYIPLIQPALGSLPLKHSPALAGWTRSHRPRQFCLLSVTFWSHFPAHDSRAPLWNQSLAQESPATHLDKHILRWVCFASITGLIVQFPFQVMSHLELILNPACFLPQDHTF